MAAEVSKYYTHTGTVHLAASDVPGMTTSAVSGVSANV